jgi:putative ABC transport system permease protein
MSWLDGLRHRLGTVLRSRAHERDVREELEFHRTLDAQQVGDVNAARRRLGNTTYYQEEVRRMTWLSQLDVLRQDVAFGWRSIRRNPGVTAMIVLTLALGLGVNAATFSFLDRMYLRPPDGVSRPDELRRYWFEVSAQRSYDGNPFVTPGASFPAYRAIAQASGTPARFALYDTDHMLFLRRGDAKTRMRGVFATASYFDVLGVRPVLGRLFTAQEDSLGSGANVAVVSHRFWVRELGADSSLLGRPLRIEHTDFTLVGVLQPDFEGLDLQAHDVWIPLASIPASHWIGSRPRWWEKDIVNGLAMLERVADGDGGTRAGWEQRATAAYVGTQRLLRGAQADTLGRVLLGPLVGTGPGREGQDVKIAKSLGGVSLVILLIACANVINLLLARAERRRREVAVRLALGISRWRLVRLLTTETMLLALLAGGAAVLAATWGGSVLRSLLFRNVEWYESPLHWRVVVFALALSAIAGLVAGIIPALQASNPRLSNALKDGVREGRPRSRLRSSLVVLQAALSVVLLAGAALFIRSLHNVRGLDIGYDVDRVLFSSVSFEPDARIPAATVAATMDQLEERLAGRPGVEAVARAQFIPMQGLSFASFWWDGDSMPSLRPNFPTYMAVSPDFFRTVGMSVLHGRSFTGAAGAREVVINEEMARRVWPGREALDRCIRFGKRDAPCHTVVGIVENGRQGAVIEKGPKPLFYLALSDPATGQGFGTTLIARTQRQAERAAHAELQSAMRQAFPRGEVKVQSMTETLDGEYWPWRLGAKLFTGFGLLALAVALLGIYSTVSYSVTQRAHEFGVRAALGAAASDLLRHVISGGVRVVALGVVIGTGLTLAAGKLVAALLYDVTPADPLVLVSVGATMLVVAVLATLVPAWRAARVDPVEALRTE